MAEWMQNCCTSLMEMYGSKFGYTQSDEISIIIPPASVTMDKGGLPVQHPHGIIIIILLNDSFLCLIL